MTSEEGGIMGLTPDESLGGDAATAAKLRQSDDVYLAPGGSERDATVEGEGCATCESCEFCDRDTGRTPIRLSVKEGVELARFLGVFEQMLPVLERVASSAALTPLDSPTTSPLTFSTLKSSCPLMTSTLTPLMSTNSVGGSGGGERSGLGPGEVIAIVFEIATLLSVIVIAVWQVKKVALGKVGDVIRGIQAVGIGIIADMEVALGFLVREELLLGRLEMQKKNKRCQ